MASGSARRTGRNGLANSHAKCAGCRNYRARADLVQVGLSSVCKDNPECRLMLTEKRKIKTTKARRPPQNGHRLPDTLRKRVRRRDNNRCRCCGVTSHDLQIHHVQFRGQGGEDEISNLILLCPMCHSVRAHGNNSRHYREMFRAYIWLRMVEGQSLLIPQVERYLKRARQLEAV